MNPDHRKWSKNDERKLRQLYPETNTRKLPALLNRSFGAVRSRAKKLHLRKTKQKRYWTREELNQIRTRYPHISTKKLAIELGTTPAILYRAAAIRGIVKTAAYLASPAACRLRRGDNVGAQYRFKPGHVPANKGLRRPGYSLLHGRMSQTTFKKGQRSGKAAINYMPLGSTRDIEGYLYRKVREVQNAPYTVNWKPVHVLLWQKHRGRIRKGQVIVFKNGNRRNFALRNLKKITRRQLMARNTIHNYPPELRRVIMLTGAIKRQIRERKEKLNGK